jgi:hypothetical protein
MSTRQQIMANYTYYYFFSILAVVMTLWIILNMVSLRRSGKMLDGQYFRPGTTEYERVIKVAGNPVILLFSVLELAFIGNLVKTIYWILALHTPDAIFLIVFAPVFLGIITAITIYYQRRVYGSKD